MDEDCICDPADTGSLDIDPRCPTCNCAECGVQVGQGSCRDCQDWASVMGQIQEMGERYMEKAVIEKRKWERTFASQVPLWQDDTPEAREQAKERLAGVLARQKEEAAERRHRKAIEKLKQQIQERGD